MVKTPSSSKSELLICIVPLNKFKSNIVSFSHACNHVAWETGESILKKKKLFN